MSPSPPSFIVVAMPERSDHADATLRHWSYALSGVTVQIINYKMVCNPTVRHPENGLNFDFDDAVELDS